MFPTLRKSLAALSAILLLSAPSMGLTAPILKIGFNLPLTGERKATGLSTRNGIELLQSQLKSNGGLQVGVAKYDLEFVFSDNQSTPSGAVVAAINLITKQQVLAVVGPNASSNAIPAGAICQSFQTAMISPTSTNPKTTQNRPFVFRACFLDNFQGEVMANFAISELGSAKAAVLYDISSVYPKGLAEYFRSAFEKKAGPASVVAFESFLSSEKDFSIHLKKIVDSGADVLFVPQYAHEIPEIIKQARKAGWNKTILGGDAWESTELLEKCGSMCSGMFFSSHFGAIGAKGITKHFVDQYREKYNQLPTGYAALGYDAASLLTTAISKVDNLDNMNLLKLRKEVAKELGNIKRFNGVSGIIDMNSDGDPVKSAVVIKINDQGQFEAFKTENPSAK